MAKASLVSLGDVIEDISTATQTGQRNIYSKANYNHVDTERYFIAKTAVLSFLCQCFISIIELFCFVASAQPVNLWH